MTLRSAGFVVAAGLVGLGLLGCLRAFGPDLRTNGAHSGLSVGDGADDCMSCHESEAEALARMQAPEQHPGHAAPDPGAGSELGPPLVADWMVADPRPCSDCHRLREKAERRAGSRE